MTKFYGLFTEIEKAGMSSSALITGRKCVTARHYAADVQKSSEIAFSTKTASRIASKVGYMANRADLRAKSLANARIYVPFHSQQKT